MGRAGWDDDFQVESWGHGLFYEVTRLADGATVFLQGEDATRLRNELERTNTLDEDAVEKYFDRPMREGRKAMD